MPSLNTPRPVVDERMKSAVGSVYHIGPSSEDVATKASERLIEDQAYEAESFKLPFFPAEGGDADDVGEEKHPQVVADEFLRMTRQNGWKQGFGGHLTSRPAMGWWIEQWPKHTRLNYFFIFRLARFASLLTRGFFAFAFPDDDPAD